MAADGEKIFESKCASCHKLDERYTGPAQRNVLQRVTPEFFMNTVLNPDENLEKHPHSKEMLAQYMTKMTNQNVNLKDARALLEYFRLLDEELKNNTNSKK
jgi:cytochrome c2